MDENLLEKHYRIKLDDRYHCNHCSYDTQLPNRALSHLQKKHGDQLAAVEEEPEIQGDWEPEESAELELEDKES